MTSTNDKAMKKIAKIEREMAETKQRILALIEKQNKNMEGLE